MNITITKSGNLAFPEGDAAWFRDEPIEYVVCARNDPNFDMRRYDGVRNYSKKIFFLLTWEMAIKQFISRHQRFHKHNWSGKIPASEWIPRAGWSDYSREVITKPDNPGINLDVDTHFRVEGFDRPMRATSIITDLTRSLIGSGGDIVTSVEVERLEKSGVGTRLHTTGEAIEAGTVIIAAGNWLGRFLGSTDTVKVVASPLLVAYPALTNRNFVRMTPFVEKSINHLHHQVDGHTYSLIGGGYFADPNDAEAVVHATERLVAMAGKVFPKLEDAQIVETYLGYKTEIVTKSGERNYQYFIREVEEGVFAVVPGKFSLAFSLAINTFKRLTGKEPATTGAPVAPDVAQTFVGPTRHARLILSALKGKRPTNVTLVKSQQS